MTSSLAVGLSPVRQALSNGAVVIVQETPSMPAISINATFRAGSLYEPEELAGLACFTGRLMDRGTLSRSAEAIAEQLDARGVTLRIRTTRHTLTLTCTCLAEDFEAVLALVMDVAIRPAFPANEIEKRRAETLTGLRQDDDNPAVRAVETLSELLYGGAHPYGRRAKGSVESLSRIDRGALVSFHKRTVRPAVLTLAIVGEIEADEAVGRVAAELEGWTGSPETPIVVPPPPSPSRRLAEIAMPGKSQSDIAYGFTAISRLDPRYYAYWMLNNILGQFGLGGRLAENIRERQGMAYYAFSSFDPTIGEGPLVVRAGVDPRNVGRAIEAIDAEVRALGEDGPTALEVEETRAYLIGSIPRLLETNYGIAGFLQSCEHFGLGLDYDRRLPGLLRSVTIDEIHAAGSELLHPEHAAVVVAGPPPVSGADA